MAGFPLYPIFLNSVKSIITTSVGSYFQGLLLILCWGGKPQYADMLIQLFCPSLGVEYFSGTLVGSWKPQPGCWKQKTDWEIASLCMVCTFLPFRIHLNHICTFLDFSTLPPGPGLYCPCCSLCLGRSPPTCSSWLTSTLPSKDVAPTILSYPKTICNLFHYRLS